MPATNYDGITGNNWRVGLGGPQLKNVSGVLQARNAADNAFADVSTGGLTALGRTVQVTSTAVDYTVVATDDVLFVTATGKTITLPAISAGNRRLHISFRVAGTCTIDGNGAETINGAATKVLSAQYDSVILVPASATDWAVF